MSETASILNGSNIMIQPGPEKAIFLVAWPYIGTGSTATKGAHWGESAGGGCSVLKPYNFYHATKIITASICEVP